MTKEMCKRAIIMAGIAILTRYAYAGTAGSEAVTAEAAVRAVNAAWFRAFNVGDGAAVAALYADDAITGIPGMPAMRGRMAIRAYYATEATEFAATGEIDSDGPSSDVGISGDLAWQSGTYKVTDRSGAVVASGPYLSVFQLRHGKWLIIRDMYISDQDLGASGLRGSGASARAPSKGHVNAPLIRCNVKNPTSCPNTNILSWSPGFAEAVRGFLGTGDVSYFRKDRPLTEQALFGLGGPPDPRMQLPGNLLLFGACPPHECAGQAAAIVVSVHGAIEGVGLVSYHCGTKCDLDHHYLDLYLRRGSLAGRAEHALYEWGGGSTVITALHPVP